MNTETTTTETKGRALRLNVYRWTLGDCTNGGISSKTDELLVACENGPIEYDPQNPPENLCDVKAREVAGVLALRLVPVALSGRWTMFGGNYATTCDSRLGEMLARRFGLAFRFAGALPIHDRTED